MFCYTNECDADRVFLRADSNRARLFITIVVQRRAVDPSIVSYISSCMNLEVLIFPVVMDGCES